MKILVTGAAGFIGFHTVHMLCGAGDQIVGLDNINDYYDTALKFGRLAASGIEREKIREKEPVQSTVYPDYRFIKADICDKDFIDGLFATEKFDVVCHLAAQAGVRYSLENPYAYIESNILGFLNVLEACRHNPVKHLVYASSSSVYGTNAKIPYNEQDRTDNPVSLYAATKKSNEMMAHAYAHLYDIPVTGLRFFTVYGPWGRPDMAPFLFTKAILNGQPIRVFNHGKLSRDFTYIDDIVRGIVSVLHSDPKNRGGRKDTARVYNIGNGQPVPLTGFIETLERVIGREAIKEMTDMQPGDVEITYADTTSLDADFGYKPDTPVELGLRKMVDWYLEFYN